MELTNLQIQEIDNYITVCGIKYYDVKAEIVDHFASILELRLANEPNLNFKKAIVEEHKKFSDRGFKRLLETKTNAVHKKFFNLTFNNLRSFFKLPKIIITIALFFLLKELMNFFQNKEDFFLLLAGISLFIMLQLLVRITLGLKQKKERFLTLERTSIFLQIVNFLFIFFNASVTIRSDKNFTDMGYNLIHLTFFILLLLFYWSGEHVYYQNKVIVKKQYANAFI